MLVWRKCCSNPHFTGGITGKIFAFFQKKKSLPTYSNFEFEKMGTKNFFLSWPYHKCDPFLWTYCMLEHGVTKIAQI